MAFVTIQISCTSAPAMLEREPSGPCWDVQLEDGFSSEEEVSKYIDSFMLELLNS